MRHDFFKIISQPRGTTVLADTMPELKKFIKDYLLPTYSSLFEITSISDVHFSYKDKKTGRVGYFEIVD